MKLYAQILFFACTILSCSIVDSYGQDLNNERRERRELREKQKERRISTSQATNPDGPRNTVEVILPLAGSDPYEIRFRHFSEQGRDAFRIGVGLDLDVNADEIYDPTQDESGTIAHSRFQLQLAPGWERHFTVNTSWREVQVSPYFGLIMPIGMTAYSTIFTDTDGTRYIDGYESTVDNAWIRPGINTGNDVNGNERTSVNVGIRFVLGSDIYIYKRAFVGFECSVGPSVSARPEVIRETDGQPDVTLARVSAGFRFNTAVTAGVRMGVRF